MRVHEHSPHGRRHLQGFYLPVLLPYAFTMQATMHAKGAKPQVAVRVQTRKNVSSGLF